MPTISYERPVTINPDWGVRNLIKAIDKGSALANISYEDARKFEEEHCAPSEELIRKLRERYCGQTPEDGGPRR